MQIKSQKKSIRHILMTVAGVLALLMSGTDICAQNSATPEQVYAKRLISRDRLMKQISFLCDTLCEGRGTAQKGGGIAGIWLEREFERIGLMKSGISYAKPVELGTGRYGRNIIGMLPGKNDKYIIIGAHYDHIGKLGKKIYPGADANASGVAALLSIAEIFATCRTLGKEMASNVIFVAFDAKEQNMAGSNALWEMLRKGELTDPVSGRKITRDKIRLMANIDQIGCTSSPLKSGRKDYMIMLGNNSLHPSRRNMLQTCNSHYAIDMDIDYTYYGSKNFTQMFYRLSDQRVFIDNGIPSVLFTSGITMNTNKTYDKPETIDLEILQKRVFLIYHWVDRML